MKSLLYKIFGAGKFNKNLLAEIKNEQIIASDEGLKSKLTYKKFRARGRYTNWKRTWLAGAIILTDKRLVLQTYSNPAINIELVDERFWQIKVSLEAEDTLLFEFEPRLFLENSSGEIEWLFRTPHAKIIYERMKKLKKDLCSHRQF